MAYIREINSEKKTYLLPLHIFGSCRRLVDTFIDDSNVSQIHAIAEWIGKKWYFRNTSSKEICFEKAKMVPYQNYELKIGQHIYFPSKKRQAWYVADLSAPRNLLLPMNKVSQTIELKQFNVLPDENRAKITLTSSKDSNYWIAEPALRQYPYGSAIGKQFRHGDRLPCDSYRWQLFIVHPPALEVEDKSKSLQNFEFLFFVSLDEESVRLELIADGKTIDLYERVHHYLLLYLARAKLTDTGKGISCTHGGWVPTEVVEHDLKIDIQYINIQIFRARKQFGEILGNVTDLGTLIQRRKGCIRIGVSASNIRIIK